MERNRLGRDGRFVWTSSSRGSRKKYRCCVGSHRIVHDECSDAHGSGFPGLWIRDDAIQPADGVILSPENIVDSLRQQGVAGEHLNVRQVRLQAILDNFLENWNPGT